MGDHLPEVSELFEHEFYYDRFPVLSALCKELIEKFDSLEKGKNFLSHKSPCFSKIVEKYRSDFDIEDREFETVFEFVKNGDHSKEPYFIFKIKNFNKDNGKFSIDVGRLNLIDVTVSDFSDREKLFISNSYEPGIYCRLTCSHFYFSFLSTTF